MYGADLRSFEIASKTLRTDRRNRTRFIAVNTPFVLGILAAAVSLVAGCGLEARRAEEQAKMKATEEARVQAAFREEAAALREEEAPAAVDPVALKRRGGRSSAAADADWPCFRGPTRMGVSENTDPPVTWSTTDHVAWKTPLPGPGASSPVVFGDRVYLTCYSGYFIPDKPGGSLDDLERRLLALDLQSGEILWDRSVPAKLPEESEIRDHGYAASTPAVDADRIYVFFGKSGVFAFDHAGEQLWQASVGDGTHGWGSASSPVLYENQVIVNASVESQSLVALDRETGAEQWRAGDIKEAWNTPVLLTAPGGRPELVLASFGLLRSYAPDSGEPLWTCDTNIEWYMVPSVVASDGVAFCLGGRSGIAGFAVQAGGRGDVTAERRLWTSEKGSNVSSPVVQGDYLYWVHDQQGIAYCADVKSGEIVYQERLERAGQFYSSAVLAAGRLYYLTRDGQTFVLAAQPEFELLATNDLADGSLFNGSPAVAGDKLLIRSDKFLYCLAE